MYDETMYDETILAHLKYTLLHRTLKDVSPVFYQQFLNILFSLEHW